MSFLRNCKHALARPPRPTCPPTQPRGTPRVITPPLRRVWRRSGLIVAPSLGPDGCSNRTRRKCLRAEIGSLAGFWVHFHLFELCHIWHNCPTNRRYIQYIIVYIKISVKTQISFKSGTTTSATPRPPRPSGIPSRIRASDRWCMCSSASLEFSRLTVDSDPTKVH